MKKRSLLILVLVLVSMMMVVTCSPKTGENALMGTWVRSHNDEEVDSITLTLKSDNTFTEKYVYTDDPEQTYSGTWMATETKITFERDESTGMATVHNYTLSGNKLTIEYKQEDGSKFNIIYTKQ